MTGAALRWLFVGEGPMGAAALEALAPARAPVAVVTAEPSLGAPPVAATARALGLPLRHADGVGDRPAQRWPDVFADLDVAVCGCWAERLAPAVLGLPRHGWLNLHPSALPAWRGADPVGWQLLAAPARLGCSVHRMTPEHDDGAVLAEGWIPVQRGDDRRAVLQRSGRRLGQLAARALDELAAGRRPSERTQHEELATWCPPAGTAAMIDPRHMRAAAGARVARAFSPEPGVAVAALSTTERFAVADDGPGGATGPELAAGDAPGAVERHGDGGVAVAFTDRWLHGRVWRVGGDAPSHAELTAPGDTRLPRGGR